MNVKVRVYIKEKKKKKVRGAECKVKPGFLLSRGGSV